MSVGNRIASANVLQSSSKGRVNEVLGVIRSQAPTSKVIEDDENGTIVTREVESSPVFTPVRDCFRHVRLRLF